ncbi:MAG: hypothetical protein L6R45_36885, partial [Anaerolineae bacterium]|nr:hypothetical protein [Anaerolineae bacterium]
GRQSRVVTGIPVRFTIYDLRFTIYDLRFTIYDLRFTIGVSEEMVVPSFIEGTLIVNRKS